MAFEIRLKSSSSGRKEYQRMLFLCELIYVPIIKAPEFLESPRM